MNILKFFTAGSVDDGKSTLIGRLLYDTDSVLDDQLEAIKNANRKNDDGTVDLAILTDGLRAEREQGITIDVAYKYFQTENRKFIIADTPGHIQYTRNMVTGASNANLAIILVDARNGVVEQTIRHSYLVSLLGIKQVILAVNKMDMVDYSETAFNAIVEKYQSLATELNLTHVHYLPVSALKGDNIVHTSERMKWYQGPSLLHYLETVDVSIEVSDKARMPVQLIIRPQTDELHDYRGYAGRVAGGSFSVGDKITVLPAGTSSTITEIEFFDKKLTTANIGQSVVLHLADDVDISRGDTVVNAKHLPYETKAIEADLCWMDTRALDTSNMYLLQHNSKTTKCKINELIYKVDINTLEKQSADEFKLNDIGRVVLKTADTLPIDLYAENKTTGSAILIDSRTNLTVGAVMFREAIS
jgi:sulfate adenylyltransferase subunit 1